MLRLRCLLLVLLLAQTLSAQTGKMVMRLLDAGTGKSVAGAVITDGAGTSVGRSDTAGYVVLTAQAFAGQPFLLVTAIGYERDTLFAPVTELFLRKPQVTLPAATISSAKVKRLLNSETENVVDYCFSGDSIFVASYRGSNGSKARLTLLDNTGQELGMLQLPSEPVRMFTSCTGYNYCVCTDGFFRLGSAAGKPLLAQRNDLRFFDGVAQCECSCKGNLYYRISDTRSFRTVYGLIAAGDSVFRPFSVFDEPKEARASMIEAMMIRSMALTSQRAKAAMMAGHRMMWDKGALAHIGMPIFAAGDSVIVFDYRNKQMRCYNLIGDSICAIPASFSWTHSQQFRILKDAATGRFYIHRFDNKERQTIEPLDIHTGKTAEPIVIERPLAENVTVYRGEIYFLWQDANRHATRQIFVQRFQ
ncbi:MAG: hypothetical protein KF744_09550 [Taibaiella sp.]|nr:hypothetical protein [Taibaiella sp.]